MTTIELEIVPLLFISIVENLFKYADFESDFQNLIQMNVTGDLLVFITENRVAKKIDSGNKSESGIGLTNIRKRLLLHYPDKHLLTYGEKDGIFKVEMEIILN